MDLVEYKTERKWLMARFDIVTATGIAKIMELTDWGSDYTEYIDKKTRVLEKNNPSDVMILGTELEGGILKSFTRKTGLKTKQYNNTIVYHPTNKRMGASPDGFVYDKEGNIIAGIEAKYAPTLSKWMDGVPIDYEAQCQWNMMCAGLDTWYIVAALGLEIFVEEIKADKDVHNYMYEIAEIFWKNFDEGNEPLPKGLKVEDKYLPKPDRRRGLYEAGEFTQELVENYITARELRKNGEKAERQALQRLKIKCSPKPGVSFPEGKITWGRRLNAQNISKNFIHKLMKKLTGE